MSYLRDSSILFPYASKGSLFPILGRNDTIMPITAAAITIVGCKGGAIYGVLFTYGNGGTRKGREREHEDNPGNNERRQESFFDHQKPDTSS